MTLDLPAIRARAEAATPGPWKCWSGWGPVRDTGLMAVNRIGPDEYGKGIIADTTQPARADFYLTHADAEFVAMARTDIPALLAEVERLREEVESLERTKDKMHRDAHAFAVETGEKLAKERGVARWVAAELRRDLSPAEIDALVAEALEAARG